MAMSLAFHIVFAALGMGMPLLMVIAEARWLRTRDPLWLELVTRWTKATAVLFAVGAVSGTVLSFELGLLWPGFMEVAGPIIGMPFSLEGFAFFTEAIFLGIVLYGRGRVPDVVHWVSTLVVAVSGAASGFFVVTANAWMNTPVPARRALGWAVDPWAAMFNPGWLVESAHMLIAAYLATTAAVGGVHAWRLLHRPDRPIDRRALAIALPVLCSMALAQPLSGDFAAKLVAKLQPVKFAAMEGQFRTEAHAPLRIGGLPDQRACETRWAIEVPGGLSYLAYGRTDATVAGLETVPRGDWPPVRIVHIAFQLMVACGMALAGAGLLAALSAWKRRALPDGRWVLRLLAAVGPLGFVAIEAGWVVTEVGRQPWIIQGWMRTREAITPMPFLVVPFAVFTAVYLLLAAVVVMMVRRQLAALDSQVASDAHA